MQAIKSFHVLTVAFVLCVGVVLRAEEEPLSARNADGRKPLQVRKEAEVMRVDAGTRPVFEYRHAGAKFKPYVKRFWTPGGVNLLRDSPHDHVHHHALMFALAADGVDFWSERPVCGRQVPRATRAVPARARGGVGAKAVVMAGVEQDLEWISKDGKALLVEKRTVTAADPKVVGASLLTWRTRLEVAPGKDAVKLEGQHYFGLGLRFVQTMDQIGRFRAAGKGSTAPEVVRGTEKLRRSLWCAYTAEIAKGKPVTVAMFDLPKNPRSPATWFTMTKPFSYLAATVDVWRQPLKLEKGKSVAFCYGVAMWDGDVSPEAIEAVYRRWVAVTAEAGGAGTAEER